MAIISRRLQRKCRRKYRRKYHGAHVTSLPLVAGVGIVIPGFTSWATAIDWIALVSPFLVGIVLGLFYFGGLWWTVQRLVTAAHPALLALISMFGRNAVALLGFYLITADRWERLVVCLIGFILARVVLVQFLKPGQDNSPQRQKERKGDLTTSSF